MTDWIEPLAFMLAILGTTGLRVGLTEKSNPILYVSAAVTAVGLLTFTCTVLLYATRS